MLPSFSFDNIVFVVWFLLILCGDIALRSTSIKDKIQAAREEVSGRDEKARQEPEQGRAAPPGRR